MTSPNTLAIRNADKVVWLGTLAGLSVTRTVPDADGGLSIYFERAGRRAVFACDNDGETLLILHAEHQRIYRDVDRDGLSQSVTTALEFLGPISET